VLKSPIEFPCFFSPVYATAWVSQLALAHDLARFVVRAFARRARSYDARGSVSAIGSYCARIAEIDATSSRETR